MSQFSPPSDESLQPMTRAVPSIVLVSTMSNPAWDNVIHRMERSPGDQYVSSSCATRPGPRQVGQLSQREREVLALLKGGLTNHEIAAALFISPKQPLTTQAASSVTESEVACRGRRVCGDIPGTRRAGQKPDRRWTLVTKIISAARACLGPARRVLSALTMPAASAP
jgi:Bacterial regulatory proteins, luxR family